MANASENPFEIILDASATIFGAPAEVKLFQSPDGLSAFEVDMPLSQVSTNVISTAAG